MLADLGLRGLLVEALGEVQRTFDVGFEDIPDSRETELEYARFGPGYARIQN